MYIASGLDGPATTTYNLGTLTVAESMLCGVEPVRLNEHTICFYSHEDSFSRETWEGKADPRKHWIKGSVGFMPADSDISSAPEKPYRETAMRFDNCLFSRAMLGHIDTKRIDYRFADVTCPATTSLAESLRQIALAGRYEQCPMLIEATTLALVFAIVSKLSDSTAAALAEENGELCSARQRRLIEYIDANLSKRISLMDLANVAALSQYHFSRQFHRRMGMSPIRFIIRRRVEMAKQRLQDPDATLAGVAYACGFGGQSHFTTSFKAITGITPGEYRRSGGMREMAA